jgi:hypothetical protein
MKRLIKRRHRLLAKLPPLDELLRGSLVERSVRCGKQSCRCAGGELHRAVYLSVTHRGGRTEQISLPRELVATVRNGIAVYRRCWEILEQVSTVNRDLLRQRRARGGGGEDGAGRGPAGARRRKSQ